MQDRYWMFQRKGVFYAQDKLSGKQKSLKTRDAAAARRMFAGLNQATEQPQMNLAMAKVYLSCKSDEMLARTWEDVMKEMEQAYTGPTLVRWQTQIRSVPFQDCGNFRCSTPKARTFSRCCAIPAREARRKNGCASCITGRLIWDGF
jgi:hypothetical protein